MQIKIGHLSNLTQNSTVIDESKSSLLLFDIVSTTNPWKDIVGKKVSKLRSIAELREFYGIFSDFNPACPAISCKVLRYLVLLPPDDVLWCSGPEVHAAGEHEG
jgi:hypothetical protein